MGGVCEESQKKLRLRWVDWCLRWANVTGKATSQKATESLGAN